MTPALLLNIDSIEGIAGIAGVKLRKLIQCHDSLAAASYRKCGA
jgi:hypothetical protein